MLALQLQLSGVLLRLWRLLCLQSRRVKANRQVWVAALAVQQTSSSTTGTRSTRGRCGSSGAQCRLRIARTAHLPSPAPLSKCSALCSTCYWTEGYCPRCWRLHSIPSICKTLPCLMTGASAFEAPQSNSLCCNLHSSVGSPLHLYLWCTPVAFLERPNPV